MSHELYFSLEELEGRGELDILIAGSGPAGVAIAEHLYTHCDEALRIGVLERGGIVTLTHVINASKVNPRHCPYRLPVYLQQDRRKEFIDVHGRFLWDGDFKDHAMMITALGGRGIVAGAHLRRFYEDDFRLWPMGQWPITAADLTEYYRTAELIRHVSHGDTEGKAQDWALSQLDQFTVQQPPWGLDIRSNRNKDISRGYDSSVARLDSLVQDDHLRVKGEKQRRRLLVATRTLVTQVKHNGKQVEAFVCIDTETKRQAELKAHMFVLAASPIESARLFLNSGLADGRPAAGRYLAEHVYYRGFILVKAEVNDPHEQFINVLVPPPGKDPLERYHINVQGEPDIKNPGHILIRLTGTAAMEPCADNRVTLSDQMHEYGIPMAKISFRHTEIDRARIKKMRDKMKEVAAALGGDLEEGYEYVTGKGKTNYAHEDALKSLAHGCEEEGGIAYFEAGRSHHEAGTLRMGDNLETSVTDANGKVHGMDNLYVGDASLFPCVGVANPMLTVTALGYRTADKICEHLQG